MVGGKFAFGDLADTAFLQQLFRSGQFDCVMHFAAHIQVGESVDNPRKYYRNNLVNALNLLDTMVEHRVQRLVFSSTAAVFGEPRYIPIDEEHEKRPINPYGVSKWMVEQILQHSMARMASNPSRYATSTRQVLIRPAYSGSAMNQKRI